MSQSSQVFEWYRRFYVERRSLGDEKGPSTKVQLSVVATLVKFIIGG